MDPDIAPLAQRLAEENNVEWRSLEGTGENGRIVERDVLDYLARVMAGEEAIDPTPEPLPEGMEAWVDDEGRPIDAPGAIDADDDGAVELASDEAGAAGPDEEDLLLAGDDLLVGADTAEAAPADEAVPGSIDAHGDDVPYAHDAAADATGAPDLFADSEPGRGRVDEVPDLFESDAASGEDAGRGGAFDFGGLPGAAASAPSAEADEEDGEAVTFDEPTRAPFGEPAPAEATDAGVAGDARQETAPAEDDAIASGAAAAASEERDAGDAAPAPVAAPAASPSAEGAWPLARVRTVVRRHVDLGGLLALQRAAALESGREQVSAAAVLLAAVRRAAERLELEAPGVALPGRGGGVLAVVPAGRGIAEIAAELAAAAESGRASDDAADLWVADLSGLGVDEAILDGDLPQLTLGRVLSDEEDGALHGTLTFAGDHDLAHAAAFLARVADLLEEPLRLLA